MENSRLELPHEYVDKMVIEGKKKGLRAKRTSKFGTHRQTSLSATLLYSMD